MSYDTICITTSDSHWYQILLSDRSVRLDTINLTGLRAGVQGEYPKESQSVSPRTHLSCARSADSQGAHLLDGVRLASVEDDGWVLLVAVLLDGVAALGRDLGSAVDDVLDCSRWVALTPLPSVWWCKATRKVKEGGELD